MADDERIGELERSFRRAGLPTFVRGYSARRAFAKALPLLAIVFVLEILNALNLDFGFWPNVGFLAGGIAISLGMIAILNLARGQRFLSIPRLVGVPEMIVFVLVPSVLPLLFGRQRTSAIVTLVGNAALLGLVYLVLGFGAVSILEWAVRRFVSLFAASLTVLVRALSLLLFFLLVIFFTTETWQIWTVARLPKFVAAAGLFVLLAAGFLLLRLPGSVRGLKDELPGEHLSRTQRVNVGLVMFLSQFLQVVFVAFAVWPFFVVFGSLLVSAGVREAWLGSLGNEVLRIPFGDTVVVITQELLRAATGMASFARALLRRRDADRRGLSRRSGRTDRRADEGRRSLAAPSTCDSWMDLRPVRPSDEAWNKRIRPTRLEPGTCRPHRVRSVSRVHAAPVLVAPLFWQFPPRPRPGRPTDTHREKVRTGRGRRERQWQQAP